MFDPDKALECTDEEDCKYKDKLGRWNYSKNLGDAILTYSGDDSLVLGLEGQWGHGKTSIINMALTHIENVSKTEDKPIIVNFNPWYFSNQNQLIQKFFDELNAAINLVITSSGLKSKFDSYVNRLTPYIIGIASIADPNRTQAILQSAEYFGNPQSDETLKELKDEINELLSTEVKQKIIVIIDDIDRLTPSEIRQIFKLVKLIADFEKIVYVLSFDKDVVIKALGEVEGSSGEKYLKKIVQIPFEVPDVYKNNIENFLEKEIEPFFSGNDSYRKQWFYYYSSALKYYFNNLRDVKLFINTLKFNYDIIDGEVYPPDFLAITVIQIFENSLYSTIRNSKDLLAGIYDSDVDIRKDNDALIVTKMTRIPGTRVDENHLKEFLLTMFPKIHAFDNNKDLIFDETDLDNWRTDLRICSPEIFDTYFKLSIPQDKFSLNELKAILSDSYNEELFSTAISNLDDTSKNSFFERFEDYTDLVDEDNIKNVITVLMDKGDILDDKTEILKKYRPMRIHNIIYQLLTRLNEKSVRFYIIKTAIEKSQNSLFIAVQEVGEENRTQGKYGLKKINYNKNQLFNSEQMEILEKLTSQKINEWNEDGRLKCHPNLAEILNYWKNWEPSKTSELIHNMITNDEDLFKFINLFTYETSGRRSVNIRGINKLIEIEEIVPAVQEIKDSHNFEQYDPDSKIVIEEFLRKYKKFILKE